MSVSRAQYDRLVKMTTTYTDPKTCEVQTAASPLDGTTNRPIVQDLSDRKVDRICPVGSISQVGGSPQPLVSTVDASPVLAEAVPTEPTTSFQSPAGDGQEAPTLVANTMGQPLADDRDPYEGM